MKFLSKALTALATSSLLAPSIIMALPAAEAEAGRALVKQYADAIVSVELVATIRMSMGDRQAPPQEVRMEPNGTVISPTGLTVTSLTEIDPRGTAEAALRNTGRGARIQIADSEYKDVKIRLADGTEIPAAVVLKDPDLDLAFIAPTPGDATEPKRTFTYVNLDNSAEAVVLADYFVILRAGKALQRVPEVHAATLDGIVEKPRQLFIPSGASIGCPIFSPDGRVLGLCVSRMLDGRPVLAAGGPAAIILPAADVADEARQAATAKPIENPKPADASNTAPAAPQTPENKGDAQ